MLQDHADCRKEEIIKACEKLYDEYSFKEISIKLISEKTTFSRPSIYNYFETKEEIFLALFQKEYEKWSEELNEMCKNNAEMTKEKFASKLAHTLENKERLLKLLSMNMYDLEKNSRIERLIDFKKSYGNAIHSVKLCVNKFFSKMSEEETMNFLYSFFPFMFGIYPYAFVTKKQSLAMKEAGMDFKYNTIYELAYKGIMQMLNVGENKNE